LPSDACSPIESGVSRRNHNRFADPFLEIHASCSGFLPNTRPLIVDCGASITHWRGWDQADLLYRTGNVRENIVRVRADQLDRAHHDHKDHRQHHSIFGDILPRFISPELVQWDSHFSFPFPSSKTSQPLQERDGYLFAKSRRPVWMAGIDLASIGNFP